MDGTEQPSVADKIGRLAVNLRNINGCEVNVVDSEEGGSDLSVRYSAGNNGLCARFEIVPDGNIVHLLQTDSIQVTDGEKSYPFSTLGNERQDPSFVLTAMGMLALKTRTEIRVIEYLPCCSMEEAQSRSIDLIELLDQERETYAKDFYYYQSASAVERDSGPCVRLIRGFLPTYVGNLRKIPEDKVQEGTFSVELDVNNSFYQGFVNIRKDEQNETIMGRYFVTYTGRGADGRCHTYRALAVSIENVLSVRLITEGNDWVTMIHDEGLDRSAELIISNFCGALATIQSCAVLYQECPEVEDPSSIIEKSREWIPVAPKNIYVEAPLIKPKSVEGQIVGISYARIYHPAH